MDGKRYDRIRAALTPKRRELFDLMCAEVAMGRWQELAPEDTRGLCHIRWRVTRRTPDIHRQYHPGQGRTFDELVFVNLCTPASVLMSRFTDLAGGRGPHDVTLAKALAVVRDPVAALGLEPVPALRWGLVWSDGTAEPLRFASEAETAPDGQENVVPGHAARHVSCDGTVALDAALSPLSCRACGATEIRGRDVLFHPWTAELFEEVPSGAGS